jgi:hypothetical protein
MISGKDLADHRFLILLRDLRAAVRSRQRAAFGRYLQARDERAKSGQKAGEKQADTAQHIRLQAHPAHVRRWRR